MTMEILEARRLLSVVSVTASRAAANEQGPVSRDFYIRRDRADVAAPLHIFYTVGGKAKQGLDYNVIGTHVVIKAGATVRRITITPIDDTIAESNESVALTLNPNPGYSI